MGTPSRTLLEAHVGIVKYEHVPAAFINAIYEEGSKTEAIAYLQETWNELCHVKKRLAALEADARRYRWLLKKLYECSLHFRRTSDDKMQICTNSFVLGEGAGTDAAIDAALSQEPGGK